MNESEKEKAERWIASFQKETENRLEQAKNLLAENVSFDEFEQAIINQHEQCTEQCTEFQVDTRTASERLLDNGY